MRNHFALEKPRSIDIEIAGYDTNRAKAYQQQMNERHRKLKQKNQQEQAKAQLKMKQELAAKANEELVEFDQLNHAMRHCDPVQGG